MKRLSQDPSDRAFLQDPYAFYDRARAIGPVVHWEEYGMPVAVSHDVVTRALKDRRLARVPPDGFPPAPPELAAFARSESRSLMNLKPPAHTKLRRSVVGHFTTAAIDGLDGPIKSMCDTLIADFPSGPFDFVAAYAAVVPVRVIARLLGVPECAAPNLLEWSHAIVGMYQPGPDAATVAMADAAAAAFLDFLEVCIDDPAGPPPDSLTAQLLQEHRAGRISRDDLLCTCILLLNAGHEATVHALGNAVVTLLGTGDAAALTTPDRIARTVEECLRVDPPLHAFTRWAQEDIEIGGQRFARGDQLACLLGAANRDPAAFTHPARFDPDRTETGLTSFGAGLHFCLGAPLARMEMRIALQALFTACPNLRLAEPPRFADIYHFHGHARLMVQV